MIQRPGPECVPVGGAARGSRLKRGADLPVGLAARGVAGLNERVHRCTCGGLHRVAEATRGQGETVTALGTCGDTPLRIAGIGACGQERGEHRGISDCELIDRPDADSRLAELADRLCRLRVGASKLVHESRPPRNKVSKRSLVQVGGVHG